MRSWRRHDPAPSGVRALQTNIAEPAVLHIVGLSRSLPVSPFCDKLSAAGDLHCHRLAEEDPCED
jgi:hypothetical protein